MIQKNKMFVVLIIMFSIVNFAQENDLNFLNGMKYATYYGPKVYQSYAAVAIHNIGLTLLPEDKNEWPKEAKSNPCLIGTWTATGRGGMGFTAKATLQISNCHKVVLYDKTNTASKFAVYSYEANEEIAYARAFDNFKEFKYLYDVSLTPTIKYPEVENINKNETDLKAYFDSTKLESIEGIFKSYKSDWNYKLGIIKDGDKIKGIIIESDLIQWKKGDVKAIFESTAVENVFSVKWFDADKNSMETFANFEGGLINIEFKNANGENEDLKLLKLYPKN